MRQATSLMLLDKAEVDHDLPVEGRIGEKLETEKKSVGVEKSRLPRKNGIEKVLWKRRSYIAVKAGRRVSIPTT